MRENVNIAVVIPALNEERAIGKVLADIPAWVDDVVVADNGSTDRTAEVAERCDARVVREPRRGYGSACLAAIAALREPDVVVFIDADYSDRPEEMDRLVDPIVAGEADMVIGSRILGDCDPGALTPQQRFGNGLACWLIRLFWGVRHTDLGPFRGIRFDSLKQLEMRDPDYGWTVEMQVKAAQQRLRVSETPVSYRARVGTSKVSGTIRGVVGAGTKILYTIFAAALSGRRRASTVPPGRGDHRGGGPNPRQDSNPRPTPPRKEGGDVDLPRRAAGFSPRGAALSTNHLSAQQTTRPAQPPRNLLVVFTRYPEPGKVKTRLIPAIGAVEAAALHEKMTRHTLDWADDLRRRFNTEVEVRFEGGDEAAMNDKFGGGFRYVRQSGGDLGERLVGAIRDAFDEGASAVIVIGTDCPDLNANIAADALDALGEHDVVLGPADDGGYYLIGLRRAIPELFRDIPWGGDEVLSKTLERAKQAGVSHILLQELSDVDRPEDLAAC